MATGHTLLPWVVLCGGQQLGGPLTLREGRQPPLFSAPNLLIYAGDHSQRVAKKSFERFCGNASTLSPLSELAQALFCTTVNCDRRWVSCALFAAGFDPARWAGAANKGATAMVAFLWPFCCGGALLPTSPLRDPTRSSEMGVTAPGRGNRGQQGSCWDPGVGHAHRQAKARGPKLLRAHPGPLLLTHPLKPMCLLCDS